MIWTREELSRRLLEAGGEACANYTPDHNGECQHCDEPYDAHLFKSAAEEISVLAANQKRLSDFIREMVLALRGELPTDWTGTLHDARTLLRERVEELQKILDDYDTRVR